MKTRSGKRAAPEKLGVTTLWRIYTSKCPCCVNQKIEEESRSGSYLPPQTALGWMHEWFYKKGCQEKKLSRELEAAKNFDIQAPLPLCGSHRGTSTSVQNL